MRDKLRPKGFGFISKGRIPKSHTTVEPRTRETFINYRSPVATEVGPENKTKRDPADRKHSVHVKSEGGKDISADPPVEWQPGYEASPLACILLPLFSDDFFSHPAVFSYSSLLHPNFIICHYSCTFDAVFRILYWLLQTVWLLEWAPENIQITFHSLGPPPGSHQNS